MTADAGGMLLLALPIPALLSGDGWMTAVGEALPIVAAAALFAAAAIAATYLKRRLAMNARPHSSPPRAASGDAESHPPLRKDLEEAKGAPRGRLSLDEKLDEALKETFPASDPFFLV